MWLSSSCRSCASASSRLGLEFVGVDLGWGVDSQGRQLRNRQFLGVLPTMARPCGTVLCLQPRGRYGLGAARQDHFISVDEVQAAGLVVELLAEF